MKNRFLKKIKMYIFPEALLSDESLTEYRVEQNLKIRDHILLITLLGMIAHPLYHFIYDVNLFKVEHLTHLRVHRLISFVSALICFLFYFKSKKLDSKTYKLIFLVFCSVCVFTQAYITYISIKVPSYLAYIMLMILIYTIRMRPIASIVYGLAVTFGVSKFLVMSERDPYAMVSHSVVTMIIVCLMSLRSYTSIRQFIKNKKLINKIINKNKYLNSTYNQLIHDVKSPLMALKHISSKTNNDGNLLRTATERVEKIILELEEDQKNDQANYNYDIRQCIEGIIEEAKIKFKNEIKQTNIKLQLASESRVELSLPLTKTIFSRVISNLINNAFEAKNTKKHEISISVKVISKKLILLISDNGKGFGDKKNVFNEGYSRKGANRGYGLSYSKKVIEESGGQINITNKDGALIEIILFLCEKSSKRAKAV